MVEPLNRTVLSLATVLMYLKHKRGRNSPSTSFACSMVEAPASRISDAGRS